MVDRQGTLIINRFDCPLPVEVLTANSEHGPVVEISAAGDVFSQRDWTRLFASAMSRRPRPAHLVVIARGVDEMDLAHLASDKVLSQCNGITFISDYSQALLAVKSFYYPAKER